MMSANIKAEDRNIGCSSTVSPSLALPRFQGFKPLAEPTHTTLQLF